MINMHFAIELETAENISCTRPRRLYFFTGSYVQEVLKTVLSKNCFNLASWGLIAPAAILQTAISLEKQNTEWKDSVINPRVVVNSMQKASWSLPTKDTVPFWLKLWLNVCKDSRFWYLKAFYFHLLQLFCQYYPNPLGAKPSCPVWHREVLAPWLMLFVLSTPFKLTPMLSKDRILHLYIMQSLINFTSCLTIS